MQRHSSTADALITSCFCASSSSSSSGSTSLRRKACRSKQLAKAQAELIMSADHVTCDLPGGTFTGQFGCLHVLLVMWSITCCLHETRSTCEGQTPRHVCLMFPPPSGCQIVPLRILCPAGGLRKHSSCQEASLDPIDVVYCPSFQ